MISSGSPQTRPPGVGAAISVRRFANDEIARVGSRLDDLGEGHRFDFLCECGDLSCSQFVRMTVAEYRASSPGSVVGHPMRDGLSFPARSPRSMPDTATLAAANGHILLHVRHSDHGQEWEFLCECGKEDCHERVLLTIDAYIALHDQGEPVLADGHQLSQIARALRLRAEADALRQQSELQVKRARKNVRDSGGLGMSY